MRGGKRPGGPGRAPPGSRRDRVPNVDSALERRKEPRFSRSVPKPFQPLFSLHPASPAAFLLFDDPAFFPSSSAFPLASTIRLSFSCLGSCQLLAACSFLLPPFSFLTLLPVLSLTFYVFSLLFLPSFCRLVLLSFRWLCSPWANECPSAAVCGRPERACAPGYWLHAGHPLRLARARGHLAGRRAGWDAAADPVWGSVLRNLS